MFFGAEQREEDDFADGARVGEKHREAVYADALAAGGRHAVAERPNVIFVHGVSRKVAFLAQHLLILEPVALLGGVVELAEGVGYFHSPDIELEALDEIRVRSEERRVGKDW